MTGTTLATMEWRALDREGSDKCRLARVDHGYLLVGHARFRDNGDWAMLDYVVRCGPDWMTLGADVTGSIGDAPVAIRIEHDDAEWRMNGAAQPQVAGAEDVDLSFTPATNLMPLNRLPQVGRLETRAAWLRLGPARLEPLDQRYTRERGALVHYEAAQSGFETQLLVDGHGFVTRYPEFWDADHAS